MELLRDRGREFSEAKVRVLGISRDSPWTHIAWAQALDLDFPLLSDWNAEAVHGFGIAQEHRGMRDVAVRSAFLIDTGGTVRGAWRYETTELPDMDELVSAARGLSS
jgi:peroxiredoxin